MYGYWVVLVLVSALVLWAGVRIYGQLSETVHGSALGFTLEALKLPVHDGEPAPASPPPPQPEQVPPRPFPFSLLSRGELIPASGFV
jgi:hypothetical protein